MRALLDRYAALEQAVRLADIALSETPVERWRVGGVSLLAKRDDQSAAALGGNKVRALQLLLAGVGPGDVLLTVGATGSTHALAVARYGALLGAACEVITWPQELNDVARATAAALEREARVTRARSVADAYARAMLRRVRRRVHWIPAGGSVPLGALGHVSAAIELVAQLRRTDTPLPSTVVVPLGSGGTVAGLLAGFAVAGVRTRVVGARVVPSIVANRGHVLRLARRTHALVQRHVPFRLPAIDPLLLEIDHGAFGGAYGRETLTARAAAELLRLSGGPRLDPTYSAKAFAVALARAKSAPDGSLLFWLTFDGRWLDQH